MKFLVPILEEACQYLLELHFYDLNIRIAICFTKFELFAPSSRGISVSMFIRCNRFFKAISETVT